MKKLTMEEYDNRKKQVITWTGDILHEIKDMMGADPDLNVVEIEPEDVPEDERYRFRNSSELQKLAGLFRIRLMPLDNMRISVRNGGLFVVRTKEPKTPRR